MKSSLYLTALALVIGMASTEAAAWPPSRDLHGDGESCSPVTIDSELGANPVIRPYVEAASEAGWDILECVHTFHLNVRPADARPDPTAPDDRMEDWVVLADPPISIVERWIRNACTARSPNVDACVTVLQDHILRDNGAQFPIIGFVAEGGPEPNPKDTLCVQHQRHTDFQGLIAFQDGVTVQRAQDPNGLREGIYCATDGWGPDVQRLVSLGHPISEVYDVARLADLPRSCGGDLIAQAAEEARRLGTDAWLIATRRNHLEAMRTGIDHMMEVQAARFAKGVTDLRTECSQTPGDDASAPAGSAPS